ncbi:MAG: C2H2-type zinc finger protein [Planctomycetes bacterium]|nr:C2H2-type zinc finger protein [Planctomycetota bacterium]
MAEGKFKCSKCDRSFSMAAHLARHTSTIHQVKTSKKLGKKKTRKRKAKRKPGRPKAAKKKAVRAKVARRAARRPIAGGTAGLIRQMQVYQGQLSAEQAGLEAQITAVDQAIEALGSSVKTKPVGPRRRAGTRRGGPRRGSLGDYILRVIRGKVRPMSLAKIADRVKKAGYKTKSKSLANMVSNTLAQLPGVKKVGRGLYRA